MIYSGVDDNWLRVELVHSLAVRFANETEGKDCIEFKPEGGFFFDARLYDTIQKESKTVEMVAVWCVVTLEALANQALAETISCVESAKKAIEYPRQYHKSKAASDLGVKLEILRCEGVEIGRVLQIANRLCELRNHIVHDKPFDYTDLGGDVQIEYFRLRGQEREKQLRYVDLFDIFNLCDEIMTFLLRCFDSDHLEISARKFLSLYEANKALQRTSR